MRKRPICGLRATRHPPPRCRSYFVKKKARHTDGLKTPCGFETARTSVQWGPPAGRRGVTAKSKSVFPLTRSNCGSRVVRVAREVLSYVILVQDAPRTGTRERESERRNSTEEEQSKQLKVKSTNCIKSSRQGRSSLRTCIVSGQETRACSV